MTELKRCPECGSIHEDELNARIAQLEAERNKLAEAVGLMTTLKPTMVVDSAHPVEMALEVLEYIVQLTAELCHHDVAKKLSSANKRIAELEQERRWIPVSERLPEEGQPVLIDFGNNEITVGIWFLENEPEEWSNGTDFVGWQDWNYGRDKFEPSDESPLRWRPLPQPPKEGE